MKLTHNSHQSGFTLAEVLISVAICAVFATAAFAANSRLLLSLKSQKETTSAIMLLQRRMEGIRASAWRDIATASYLKDNIISNPAPTNPNLTTQQIANYVASVQNSELPLASLTERITVNAYPPDASIASAVVQRDSTNPAGQIVSTISNNPSETRDTVYTYLHDTKDVTLLRVDIRLTWNGAGPRAALRSRQISSIFAIGNIAP